MRSIYLDPSLTIKKAASRVRGDRLRRLYELCETQKTISTRRLMLYVNELARDDCQDALHFKALADFVRKHSEDESE